MALSRKLRVWFQTEGLNTVHGSSLCFGLAVEITQNVVFVASEFSFFCSFFLLPSNKCIITEQFQFRMIVYVKEY